MKSKDYCQNNFAVFFIRNLNDHFFYLTYQNNLMGIKFKEDIIMKDIEFKLESKECCTPNTPTECFMDSEMNGINNELLVAIIGVGPSGLAAVHRSLLRLFFRRIECGNLSNAVGIS